MHIQTLRRGASRLVLVSALGGLALAGCNRAQTSAPQTAAQAPPPLAALPLADVAVPINPAPPAEALPAAPRARVGRLADPGGDYAFAERAYGLNRAFGDAPPDYTFDYDGVRPWVWSSNANDLRVVEPLAGGDRYYYFDPGADAPYLIRDPQYAYGFDGGELVVVYDRSGRALGPDQTEQLADRAGRYLARAEALYSAARGQQREAVAQANWRARREALAAERAQWADDAQQQQDWRAYHQAHDADEQAHWDDERYRREAEAARFAETINDAALAARDWQAARDAQAHGGGRPPGPGGPAPGGPPPAGHGFGYGSGGGPAPAAAPAPVQPPIVRPPTPETPPPHWTPQGQPPAPLAQPPHGWASHPAGSEGARPVAPAAVEAQPPRQEERAGQPFRPQPAPPPRPAEARPLAPAPRPEAPKPEAPRWEAPRPETPRSQAPKPEAPRPEASRPEPPKPAPPRPAAAEQPRPQPPAPRPAAAPAAPRAEPQVRPPGPTRQQLQDELRKRQAEKPKGEGDKAP